MFSVTFGESRTVNMGEVKVGSKSGGGGIGIRRKVKLLPPFPLLPMLEWYLTTEEEEEDRGERDPSLGQYSSLPPFGHFFWAAAVVLGRKVRGPTCYGRLEGSADVPGRMGRKEE